MRPQVAYIVCASPRCGSTLFCSALIGTRVAGNPVEFFVPGYRDEFFRALQLHLTDYRDYMDRAIAAGATPNGVFGMKLHAVQTPHLLHKVCEHLGRPVKSLHEALEIEFPQVKYIWLTRQDKVAQAVSYYRAIMTNDWWGLGGSKISKQDEQVPFNQYGIRRSLSLIEASDQYWEGYFSTYGIEPLRITYEELTAEYEKTVRGALTFLGLPLDAPVRPPATRKVSNERSVAWASEFVACEKRLPITLPPELDFGAPY